MVGGAEVEQEMGRMRGARRQGDGVEGISGSMRTSLRGDPRKRRAGGRWTQHFEEALLKIMESECIDCFGVPFGVDAEEEMVTSE